ncbi:MAG: hypothetical protein H6613_17555 [Ignavibacteriales bacterium]|nr:hypothetical protein [Ignavibacteriales bacterium]
MGYLYNGSDLTAGQGHYDLCIAANPNNKNEVYVGGVNTWKSTDGGSNWNIVTIWSDQDNGIPAVPAVHADKHALAFQPGTTGTVLWEGNDGGIYKVTNSGSTYEDKSNGIIISQIYRIGVSQTNSTKIMTGLQDNGSKLFNTGIWTDVNGGDGMECIIDYSNPNYMYSTYTEGQISISTNGATFQQMVI